MLPASASVSGRRRKQCKRHVYNEVKVLRRTCTPSPRLVNHRPRPADVLCPCWCRPPRRSTFVCFVKSILTSRIELYTPSGGRALAGASPPLVTVPGPEFFPLESLTKYFPPALHRGIAVNVNVKY